MQLQAAPLLLAALACCSAPLPANAASCTEVTLPGPFAPRRLMKCVNGLDVRRSTDPNSCPSGWKIWAPESREDWDTVVRSGVLPVQNPHFIVDVTRPENGCGGCRSPMNSDNPAQSSWRTSNGERWWLRSSGFGEPNGDYEANCYLNFWNWHDPDNVAFNDGRCSYHSRDYLCQPSVKVDCTNRTDEITGPCKSEGAIFRHSNCTPGVCEQGKYLVFKGETTIEECQQLCEAGRQYTPIPTGLTEKIYTFRQNGRWHDVSSMTPTVTRVVETINYPSTGGNFPGCDFRDHFYVRWEGALWINTGGRYKFLTTSDDGSKLLIDGSQVLDNGGWHGMRRREGSVDLTAGTHPLIMEFFEGGGGAGIIFEWEGPDSNNQRQVVPASAWRGSDGPTYELPGPFKNTGPCMAYSMTADEKCLIYTDCQSVGQSSVCDSNLAGFLADNYTDFKTCVLPTVAAPVQGAVF